MSGCKGKSLYLGLRPPQGEEVYHLPMIEIEPFGVPLEARDRLLSCTHLILTSRTTAEILKRDNDLTKLNWEVIAVGEKTAKAWGKNAHACYPETAEGVVAYLKTSLPKSAYVFYPHSKLSRPVISNFLKASRIKHIDHPLYTSKPIIYNQLPDLSQYSEVVFTSPSTVDAFLKNFKYFPKSIPLKGIGPITENYLTVRLKGDSLLAKT